MSARSDDRSLRAVTRVVIVAEIDVQGGARQAMGRAGDRTPDAVGDPSLDQRLHHGLERDEDVVRVQDAPWFL